MSKNIKENILLVEKKDRRLLSNVRNVDSHGVFSYRRGKNSFGEYSDSYEKNIEEKNTGTRYESKIKVIAVCEYYSMRCRTRKIECTGIDISSSGILLKVEDEGQWELLSKADRVLLKFKIDQGTMPEGYETNIKIRAIIVREQIIDDDFVCGVQFVEPLTQYFKKRKDRYTLLVSSIFLSFIVLFIVLMRVESVVYFKFNKYLYLYSIIASIFLLSRYLISILYKPVPVDLDYTPGVSIIIPCFNEEKWIQKTIQNAVNQDYPIDKLEVIVVDDASNDNSVSEIKEMVEKIHALDEYYDTKKRVSYYVQPENAGKRHALVKGVEMAKHELVVFVDSDSFLDAFAVRNLVQPFKDPKMGGVTGRTEVANTYTNVMTKMQSVRYYIAFRIFKAAESYFDAVTCLSGPISCYRKDLVEKYKYKWMDQKFLGQTATFGDDRSMTNYILKHYRTSYQDTAICSTIVPHKTSVFLRQQMRWKRSWLRESIRAAGFIYKKEPFMSLLFYIGLLVPIFAPVVFMYNLVFVPIVYGVFPTTFIVGILTMATLMSAAQLFLRKSTTWVFGMLFCFYYEIVLLWQMPIAWVTFWKSVWGTRLTPQDIEQMNRKDRRKYVSSHVMEKQQ